MAILLLATTPISASQVRRSDLFVLRFRRDWPQDFQMLDQYRTRDGLVLAKNKGVDRGAIEHEFFSEARPTSIIQRFETPEEIAALVAFVCSPLASAINGAALRVDGGVVRSIA